MKNTKKVLSVVLAVIMAFSALTLVAFAHSYTGEEVDGTSSVKFEVAQVASATSQAGDTYTAVDNDIYAVSVYLKAAAGTGVANFQIPIQYDKTKFEPMILMDEGDLYTGSDDFGADIGISAIDFYEVPERYSDTGSYDANGNATTSKLKIKCFGMKHANAGAGLVTQAEFVAPTDARFAAWSKGLDTSVTGITFVSLDLVSNYVKGVSCINTSYGKLINDEYVDVITVYFKRIDGVSEADCYGAQFGVQSADGFGIDLVSRAAVMGSGTGAGLDLTATNYLTQINFINAAVETPVKALATLTAAENAKSQQICFNLAEGATAPYSHDSIASVDYRFVAQFSTSAFPIQYDEGTGKITATDIDEVGFVMAKQGDATAAELTALSATEVAALSKTEGTIRKCWTKKVSTDMAGGASFAFSCRIAGIAVTSDTVAAEYLAVPYVISGGNIAFGQVMTSGVQTRYNTYVDTFLAKKNA